MVWASRGGEGVLDVRVVRIRIKNKQEKNLYTLLLIRIIMIKKKKHRKPYFNIMTMIIETIFWEVNISPDIITLMIGPIFL